MNDGKTNKSLFQKQVKIQKILIVFLGHNIIISKKFKTKTTTKNISSKYSTTSYFIPIFTGHLNKNWNLESRDTFGCQLLCQSYFAAV